MRSAHDEQWSGVRDELRSTLSMLQRNPRMQLTRRSMWSMLWFATAASVPLSVRLYLPAVGTEVLFPAEPLLGLLCFIVMVRWFRRPKRWSPLSKAWNNAAVRMATVWIAIHICSALFSSDPLASWKVVLVQTVYVIALLSTPFGEVTSYTPQWERRWEWHDAAFLIVVASALTASAIGGLDRMSVNFAPFPFYKDHTLYAAVLSFVFFHVLSKFEGARTTDEGPFRLLTFTILLIACVAALILSYGRGAWFGTFSALVLYGAFRLPRKWAAAFLFLTVFATLLLVKGSPGTPSLEQASQRHGVDPLQALRSMTNTTTDSNNIDRVIRWKASIRMFLSAPLAGLGSGTWQNEVERFITPEEQKGLVGIFVVNDTLVKTAASFGDLVHVRDHAGNSPSSFGSAHSEYLLSLAENGIAGGLWWLVVAILVVHRTCRCLASGTQRGSSPLVWSSGLALCAYLGHAFFNNYLDECKAALLFWPSLVILFERPRSG